MHILVHIGAKAVLVSVGEGDQPVRWLANVGVARHDDQQGRSLGVPVGVKIDNGTMLNMQDSISESGPTEARARAVGRALMKIPQPRFDFGDQKRYDKLAIFRPSRRMLRSLLKYLTSRPPFGSHGGVACVPHVRS